MSSSWSALHARLLRTSERLTYQRQYEALASRHAALRRYGDAPALLSMLHGPGDAEEKNRCLLALVSEAGDEAGEVAATLMTLALWPGLDAVRRRLIRYYGRDPQLLDAELLGRLSLALRRAGGVHRVAATLLRNLERDLRRDLMRNVKNGKAHEDLAAEVRHLANHSEEDQVAESDLAPKVLQELGRDGPLIVAIVLDGLSQKAAADLLGLSHDVARKRYQRAMRSLQLRAFVARDP